MQDVHEQLYDAAAKGDLGALTSALQNGADASALDQTSQLTPLAAAAHHGHAEIVKMLAPKVQSVNSHWGPKGYTALHYAAEKGHKEVSNTPALLAQKFFTRKRASFARLG